MTRKIIYARGFPYGAPLVMLRGGGLKISGVLGYLREEGFRWNGASHAYETYKDRSDLARVLFVLRNAYGCEILAKKGMDENYILADFAEVQT